MIKWLKDRETHLINLHRESLHNDVVRDKKEISWLTDVLLHELKQVQSKIDELNNGR